MELKQTVQQAQNELQRQIERLQAAQVQLVAAQENILKAGKYEPAKMSSVESIAKKVKRASFWDKLTPEQRSKEMKRRQKVAAANRG